MHGNEGNESMKVNDKVNIKLTHLSERRQPGWEIDLSLILSQLMKYSQIKTNFSVRLAPLPQ